MESKEMLFSRAKAARAQASHIPFAYTAIAALAPAILLAVIVVVASSMASV